MDRQAAGLGSARALAAGGRGAASLLAPAPPHRCFAFPALLLLPPQVVALGGSITRGTGATSPGAAYISRFFKLLNATFPHRWVGGGWRSV